MPTFEFTAPDGQKYRVNGPEGATEAEAFQMLQSQLGGQAPAAGAAPARPSPVDELPAFPDEELPEPSPEPGVLARLGDMLGTAGDFAQGTIRDITGADETSGLQRGAGLGARTVAGAVPKTAAGLADLGATVLNVIPELISRGDVALGGKPLESRLPTDSVASVNDLLDQFFPAPANTAERMVELGGEALLTGGGGAAALASRAPQVRSVSTLGDDIANAFRETPVAVGAAEFGGGAGAQLGGELAAEADLGPVGQLIASLGGGLAGAVSPVAASQTARAAAGRARRSVEPLTPGGAERRAARELQARAGDPEAAAQAAREAPEGVTGARASGDLNLRRAERRVMEDKPHLADAADEALAGAERRTIAEFSEGLVEGQDPVAWQRAVVERAAPEGTTITGGQPDEMLDEAFQSFRQGYTEIAGYPIQTKIMQVEGGDVMMPEILEAAVSDPRVLANTDARQTVGKWLEATFDDVARRGEPLTGAADDPNVQFMSEDLLEFRSAVRQKQRQLRSAGRTNPDAAAQADILKNVDRSLTEVLESQAPEAASDALRALDARYADFKTVEDAVLRGTPGELTPQKLSQSIKMQSGSRGRVARGDTGDLGTLAEQGRNVRDFVGKQGKQDQALARTMRDMTPEQAQSARSDLVREIARRGSKPVDGEPRLNGESLLKTIDENRSTLRAAGFEDADITRLEQIARRLRMIQSPNPRADTQLIDDHLSAVAGLLSRVAGAKVAKNIVKRTGTGGPGALTLTGFMARLFQRAFGDLSITRAEQLIADAMQPTPEGRELFTALLTRSTAPEIKQARAKRILNAWAAQASSTTEDE